MKSDFEKLLEALRATDLRVTAKIDNKGEIDIECGMHYSDEFFQAVWTVVQSLDLDTEVSICACVMSPNTTETININGGYRSW